MTAKRRHAPGESHERWLVSYADFITLLFAFFVVLFATTQNDKSRAKAVSEAVDRALREGALAPKVVAILGGESSNKGRGHPAQPRPQSNESGAPETEASADLRATMQALAADLQQEIKDQKVRLKLEPRGLIIGLEEAAFFDSGEDAIKPSSYPILEKLAQVLSKLPNPLRLEGHTDSVPINNSRFHDNWELSAARSIAMLRLLRERFAIESGRMAIVGYADTNASEPETTPEARARNRRVDVVVVSDYGMRAESSPSETPAIKKN
jgi:chemotaxis protein MotB